MQENKNKVYLDLAKKVTKRSWLIVYLTAASPVFDGSFFCDDDIGKDVVNNYSSARCSTIGYWNDFTPILNYADISEYVDSIQHYVDDGSLKAASELYYPVRLKPRGENSLENLREKAAAKYDENSIWIKTGWNQSELVRDAATKALSLQNVTPGKSLFNLLKPSRSDAIIQ